MSVVGLGISLVQPGRIDKLIARFGDRFIKRVFLDAEVAYAQTMKYPHLHLSTRFAAKQALKKAIGAKSESIGWRDVEVIHAPSGAPKIRLHGRILELSQKLKIGEIHVSLSHTSDLASAIVVTTDDQERR